MGIHDGHREKRREQFLSAGLDSFADHEVLELLLFYAIPRRDTNETAHRLMERFGSLDAVFSAPVEELCKVEGIGRNAAALITLVPRVYGRVKRSAAERETVLNTTRKAGRYLMDQLAAEKEEKLYELCLDRKGKLLACRRISEGSVSGTAVDVRRIVENALLTGASAVILGHNHPSGVALPSAEDVSATMRVRKALEAVDVPLVDHIIVADEDFVSMADSGYFSGTAR